MQIKKNLLLLCMCALFFCVVSCSKTKNCPAFNESDMAHMPYKMRDTLVFKNAHDSVFEIFLLSFDKSEAYVYECKDAKKICPCINYVEVVANDTRRPSNYTLLRMEQSDVSDMQYFKYNILNFGFEFDFKNELPHIQQMPHMTLIGQMTIGNHTYNQVVEINNEGLSLANVSKVYFNKNNGLLRFVERSSGTIWDIVNP